MGSDLKEGEEKLMARWLVIQLDGGERHVPKSVALAALRKNLAVRPDLTKRVIFERSLRAVPSSCAERFNRCSLPLVAIDPRDVVKRPWRDSHGLLVNYPIKDQRGKLGRTPKVGHKYAEDRA